LESLGTAKDAIGEWHDWEKLIAIAAKVLDDGPKCRVMRGLKARSERNYRRALSVTKRLRRECLPTRQKSAGPPRSQKALKAIVTMAA